MYPKHAKCSDIAPDLYRKIELDMYRKHAKCHYQQDIDMYININRTWTWDTRFKWLQSPRRAHNLSCAVLPICAAVGFRAIPKLTRWHCGTNPSTFERIRQYIKADEDEKDELSAEELIAAAGGSPGMPLFAPKLTYLYRKPRLSTYEKSVNLKGLSPLPEEPQVCLFLPQS